MQFGAGAAITRSAIRRTDLQAESGRLRRFEGSAGEFGTETDEHPWELRPLLRSGSLPSGKGGEELWSKERLFPARLRNQSWTMWPRERPTDENTPPSVREGRGPPQVSGARPVVGSSPP